jgi:hypothetical protein
MNFKIFDPRIAQLVASGDAHVLDAPQCLVIASIEAGSTLEYA